MIENDKKLKKYPKSAPDPKIKKLFDSDKKEGEDFEDLS